MLKPLSVAIIGALMYFFAGTDLAKASPVSAPAVICQDKTCFETERPFQGQNFFLRGVAFFQQAFSKVYKIGFYTPRRIRSKEQVLSKEMPKAVIVQYDRDLDIRQLFAEMKKDMPAEQTADPSFIDQFVKIALAVYPIRGGERHEFIYQPGKGTLLVENGKPKLWIRGHQFARTFFGFWLKRHQALIRPSAIR